MVGVTALAAVAGPVPAFAAAFVGWNPLLAIDFGGGGHNDVWMMAFVLGALVLASRRPRFAGASWALAGGVKWVALWILPLQLLSAERRQALKMIAGFAAVGAVLAGFAFYFFGTAWITTLGTFAHEDGESKDGKDSVYPITMDERINPIASYLKGAFYWHFDSKANLVSTLLAERVERPIRELIARLRSAPADANMSAEANRRFAELLRRLDDKNK